MSLEYGGRGPLVSIEGLNGVGKTYLTNRVVADATDRGQDVPLVVEEFSRRATGDGDLSRRLLRTLLDAAGGDFFLRGGHPRSETLMLLAIKCHDLEDTLPALLRGSTVIEGRSVHSTAVYQSLILHPDDDAAAAATADAYLATAARWRPLPDLTVLLVDDVEAAVDRAQRRDRREFSVDEWRIHYRAAPAFDRLAAADPEHVRLLDRRAYSEQETVEQLRAWIAGAPRRPLDSYRHLRLR